MDPHPTPFPGKNQPPKPKPNWKTTGRSEPPKPASREHVTYRQKRVFGTDRNANIPTRTAFEKPTVDKPSVGVSKKQPHRTRPARVPVTEDVQKWNFPENPKPESNQKRVSIQEEAREKTPVVKSLVKVPRKQQQRTLAARVPVTEDVKKENFPENPKPESTQKRVSTQEEAGEKTPFVKSSIGVTRKQFQRAQAARVPVIEAAKKENSPEIPKPELNHRGVSLQEEAGEKTPAVKISIGVHRKQPQRTPAARVTVIEDAKKENSPEILKPKSNEKRLSLQELEESGEKTPFEKLRTPIIASPCLSQRKVTGSSYHSAKICSKCEFDKLETSSYWLAQIKLPESVGKHFVSAAFFKLALECKAEPIGKLRFEMKQYLARNVHLVGQNEWQEVCVSYGVLKDEKVTERFDSAIGKSDVLQNTNVEQPPDQEVPDNPEHHVFCETETD